MTVGGICNRVVVTADRSTTIQEAAKLMRDHHVGTLIVAREEDAMPVPIGILTDRDIVVEVVAAAVDQDALTVGDVMSIELTTVQEESSVWDALEIMRSRGVRRLPVVNRRGGLEGILTLDDVLDLLAEAMRDLTGTVTRELEKERTARIAS